MTRAFSTSPAECEYKWEYEARARGTRTAGLLSGRQQGFRRSRASGGKPFESERESESESDGAAFAGDLAGAGDVRSRGAGDSVAGGAAGLALPRHAARTR